MNGNKKLSQLNKLIHAQGMVEMYERMQKPESLEFWQSEYSRIFKRVYG
jgi:hypothetical protein